MSFDIFTGKFQMTMPDPFANFRESPMQRLGRLSSQAEARGDQKRLQELADEFVQLLLAGDPEAQAVYRQHQNDALGEDPLAEGAFEWPDELGEPGNVITVPESEPLHGWRMWAIDGSTLVAPFLTAKWQLDKDHSGVAWRHGVNTTTDLWCSQDHGRAPTGRKGCLCGIRATQSKTVLDVFAAHMMPTLGQPAAYAEVEFWGVTAAYADIDDWRYTARAEHARIVSDLHVFSDYQPISDDLGKRYGVDVVDW